MQMYIGCQQGIERTLLRGALKNYFFFLKKEMKSSAESEEGCS